MKSARNRQKPAPRQPVYNVAAVRPRLVAPLTVAYRPLASLVEALVEALVEVLVEALAPLREEAVSRVLVPA